MLRVLSSTGDGLQSGSTQPQQQQLPAHAAAHATVPAVRHLRRTLSA
jgi:hypothetical protein